MAAIHRVIILGGGFGGLSTALALKNAAVDVSMIDRRNYHLFQPLLYQVATGQLSPANIAAPLRGVLRKQTNARVLLGEVIDIDTTARTVQLKDGDSYTYDTLVVATGSSHTYFGRDEWSTFAPGLKTIEDATEIRRRVLGAFELAELNGTAGNDSPWLTFVIVGGGPTGVELAGALAELAHHTLKYDFRSINPARARILLVEGSDRLLRVYPPNLSARAQRELEKIGVTVMTHTHVTDIQADHILIKRNDQIERIETRTILWGAGVQANPLGKLLAQKAGAETDRAGRVLVGPDCAIPGHPELFVIGDLANFKHETPDPLPGVAQVAMQQGDYVAKLIKKRLQGETLPPFKYHDKGNMAVIGRAAAVVDMHFMQLTGYIAWFAWLLIHVLYLVTFESRLAVALQWVWNFLTRQRANRLITEGTLSLNTPTAAERRGEAPLTGTPLTNGAQHEAETVSSK